MAGQGNYQAGDRAKVLETVDQLSLALDLALPWTFVVEDPSGLSDFRPMNGVRTEPLD